MLQRKVAKQTIIITGGYVQHPTVKVKIDHDGKIENGNNKTKRENPQQA